MPDKEFYKGVTIGVLISTAVAVGGFTGWKKMNLPENGILSDAEVRYKMNLLESVMDEYYLDEIDESKLKESVYAGLLSGLEDPYSRYYTAEEYKEEQTGTEGSYSGIGVAISDNENGGVRVEDCYEGGPAYEAGVEVGDVISALDGVDVTEKTTTDVVTMIREDEDQHIVLTIHREDEEDPLELEVVISDVELPTVFHEMLENQVGYLQITQFNMVTSAQFETALADLREQGMKKLVIDLRGNPGGLLSSVCDILRQILPEGLIVYTEDKYGEREEFTCDGETPLDIPLAVLVNENSASASEIFAGAVKDHGIGTLVGTTTFGKGIVQSLQELNDGSAVKLTTSRYYTPNGNNIHGVGIVPDVEEKLDTSLLNKAKITHEEDNQLQKALEILREEK